VKPAPFEYIRAESVEHAIAELAERGDEAAVLAGGQSLIALMNLRLATPGALVDIGRLVELATIATGSDVVELGAAVTASHCERDAAVRGALPVLPEAIGHVGHPQIRTRTTIGGNIAHADPASELPAVLLGLDGAIELTSAGGVRTVAAADFFLGPWTTARRSDELLTRVAFPVPVGLRAAFVELARRPGDYALAGAFVGIRADDGVVAECRIALCGVADTPVRAAPAETALVGLSLDDALAGIADVVRDGVEPSDGPDCSAGYRRHVAGTVARRALGAAVSGPGPMREVA
jgi:CO/xanthine dehydrogenase FAD-binding subunit